MRRAIAPFLATGVVLSGAAVVVANPVVPLPSDIRVSASDFTADGERLDVLDPQFLQSIGAIRQDWLSSIEVLQRLFNDVSNNGRDSVISAFGAGMSFSEPAISLPVDSFTGPHERSVVVGHSPLPTGVPTDTIEGVVGALADIGTSFGEAGITFVRQVSMAPAVALVLTQRVVTQLLMGKIGPEEALRQLIVEPLTALLTGHPHLTGIDAIDEAFHESALKPLIRALIRYLPKPIGQPGGLIEQADQTVGEVADKVRDGRAPSTDLGAARSQPELTTGSAPETPGAPENDPSGDGGVAPPAEDIDPGTHKLPKPGEAAREFGLRVQQGIDNFQSTIKRFTLGGRKNVPASKDDSADDKTGTSHGDTVDQPGSGSTPDTQAPDNDSAPASSSADGPAE